MKFHHSFHDSLYLFQFVLLTVNECQVWSETIIKTNSGPVNGNSLIFNGFIVKEFLSIPYAEPPVGSNRFGRPVAVKNWNNTYDATRIRYSCWQKPNQEIHANLSEDCLFLNIYTSEQILNNTELSPVMIYIHGGGLYQGDGYAMNGTFWTTYGVVMTSINYRLGAFGFISSDDPSAPDNAGLLDQILAIQWIKDNIKQFGGDHNQITIFGESAGSFSVSALIVSPLSKGLFRRAIMQSGAFYYNERDRDHRHSSIKSQHIVRARNMSESLGCPTRDPNWLDCLRKVDAKTLLDKTTIEATFTYGDEVLPFGIEEAFRLNKINSGIDLISGTTSSEGAGSAVSDLRKVHENITDVTKDQLRVFILNKYSENKTLAESVFDYYLSKVNESDPILLLQSFADIYTDTFMLCPTYYFAKHYAELGADKNVYFYRLTHNSKNGWLNKCDLLWPGVCHADDLPFIYNLPIFERINYTADDYQFTLMINRLWTNFAKSGNPLSHSLNTVSGVAVNAWPTFREVPKYLVLPKVMELSPFNLGNVAINPYEKCDTIWKYYFDK